MKKRKPRYPFDAASFPDAPGWGTKKVKLPKERRKKKKKVLERHIEKGCIRIARRLCGGKKRMEALKMNTWGHNDWPDRQFFLPGGVKILVEFKRPGKKASPGQALLHRKLRHLGHKVEMIDNEQDFIKMLGRYGIC